MSIQITTNNHRLEILDASQLTMEELKEFDYLDIDALMEGRYSASFVRYKKELYDLGDMMSAKGNDDFKGWTHYTNDTYFSGKLFKHVHEDGEDYIIAGTYYVK